MSRPGRRLTPAAPNAFQHHQPANTPIGNEHQQFVTGNNPFGFEHHQPTNNPIGFDPDPVPHHPSTHLDDEEEAFHPVDLSDPEVAQHFQHIDLNSPPAHTQNFPLHSTSNPIPDQRKESDVPFTQRLPPIGNRLAPPTSGLGTPDPARFGPRPKDRLPPFDDKMGLGHNDEQENPPPSFDNPHFFTPGDPNIPRPGHEPEEAQFTDHDAVLAAHAEEAHQAALQFAHGVPQDYGVP